MMSRQVFSAIRYGSLPALGLGFLQLRAESTPDMGEKVLVVRPMRAKDLPIYSEPKQAEYRLIPEAASSVRDAVSVVRKQVWKFSDSFQGAINFTQKTYRITEETFHSVVKYIKTEEGFYPRAGVISIAGLAGLVLARRGGVVRKVLYTGGLMTATTSLCYPYQAVRIGKAEMEWVKTKASELYKGDTTKPAVEKVASVAATEEKASPEKDEMVAGGQTKGESSEAEKTEDPDKVDHGQSNPADKDMYSTRS